MQVQTEAYLILSMVLFVLGTMGVLLRRNAILVFMSVELMLNATNLALAASARHWGSESGHLFAFFIITVAAAEVAVGLALIVAIFRSKKSINIDELRQMEG
ncbi:MAG: NADH-quinone oxidoreductase subunit NuoK [Candidatus Flexifilum sp.]|jgi:NADH-quinone oxidoreductase subunit K